MTVMGERIVMELNGISCIPIKLYPEPKKGIASTRQFGRNVTDFEELCESVTWHCTKTTEKLRNQGSVASVIFVFIKTNRHSKNKEQYSRSIAMNLPEHSDYTPQFVKHALSGLRQIFQPGYNYHKAGVILTGIIDKASAPYSIFEEQKITDLRNKKTTVMTAIDRINKRWGHDTLFLAQQGVKQGWHGKCIDPRGLRRIGRNYRQHMCCKNQYLRTKNQIKLQGLKFQFPKASHYIEMWDDILLFQEEYPKGEVFTLNNVQT